MYYNVGKILRDTYAEHKVWPCDMEDVGGWFTYFEVAMQLERLLEVPTRGGELKIV